MLSALRGNTTYSEKPAESVRQREINIIQFPADKKRKPLVIKGFPVF